MSYRKITIVTLLTFSALGGAYYLGSRKSIVRGEVQGEQKRELSLTIEPQVLDLGTVMMNQEKTFKAVIRNHGQQPIKIAKIERSCGCTSVSVEKQIVQPSNQVELSGVFVPQKPGRFRQLVKIIEDNILATEHTLEVVGQVESRMKIFPESILLNPSVFEDKADEQVVVIKNNTQEQVTIQQPTGMPEGISVKMHSGVIEPNKEAKLILRAEPRFLKETDFQLTFPTNHKDQGSVTTIVQLRPKGGFALVPERLRLGVISKKDLLGKPVRLSLIGQGVKYITIAEVVLPSFLKMAKKTMQKGERMELEFVFDKQLHGISLEGMIRIECVITLQALEQKRTVVLNVPISGLVRD